jgi:hypothetical protein
MRLFSLRQTTCLVFNHRQQFNNNQQRDHHDDITYIPHHHGPDIVPPVQTRLDNTNILPWLLLLPVWPGTVCKVPPPLVAS